MISFAVFLMACWLLSLGFHPNDLSLLISRSMFLISLTWTSVNELEEIAEKNKFLKGLVMSPQKIPFFIHWLCFELRWGSPASTLALILASTYSNCLESLYVCDRFYRIR